MVIFAWRKLKAFDLWEHADPRLREHRDVWDRKPVLRAVYAGYHRRLPNELPSGGRILEIAGVVAIFRDMAPNTISVDLASSPWVDVCCDARELPFADGTFSGIAMLDVLHHLARPATFAEGGSSPSDRRPLR